MEPPRSLASGSEKAKVVVVLIVKVQIFRTRNLTLAMTVIIARNDDLSGNGWDGRRDGRRHLVALTGALLRRI